MGTFRLPLEYPVEVSDLALALTGSIDPGGEVRLSFYPHLEPALIEGLDWSQPEN